MRAKEVILNIKVRYESEEMMAVDRMKELVIEALPPVIDFGDGIMIKVIDISDGKTIPDTESKCNKHIVRKRALIDNIAVYIIGGISFGYALFDVVRSMFF